MIAFVVAALGISSTASAGNLVVNGSFETGDFTGWTQFGNTGFTGVQKGAFDGVSPTDGSYQAYFGAVGSIGGISQNIATVAGGNYNVQFDLANLSGGGTPVEYSIQFGTTVLKDVTTLAAFGYTHFDFTATATSSMTGLVAFGFRQDVSYFLLDNISVTLSSVPEPSTLFMAGTAILVGLGYTLRRRKAKAIA